MYAHGAQAASGPKGMTTHTLLFLLYLPLALCIVFSSKTDFLLLSTRLLKSPGFLLFYYVTSLSWSKRWIPMIFVLLPAAICCSIMESQNPNTTQMLVWILETLVGFGVIVFAEKPEYSESSDGKVTETISKGRHNDAKRVDNEEVSIIASITDMTTVLFGFERKWNRCSGFGYHHILALLLDMKEIFGPEGFTIVSSGFVRAWNEGPADSKCIFHSPTCKGGTLAGLKMKMTPNFSVLYKGMTFSIPQKLLRFQRECICF